ncbi:hypothetical protein SEA_COMRADE_150 [Streptomyces phage Comrade]|uniref:Uncharacterized protein n=2 Tax=Gilsonvirus comrade TaxID=2846395 RepID=A0A385DVA7_9CAUD|nr:hypothetical protein HWB84_gp119 [Streptomyces phage Comrade]AXQ63396.1 hypothetical protein SEA_COMRADE_150 [Streptomyces phage Comrade]QQO39815.1 hypothetical protein SEA_BELFORT_153 [Streptomyces phage Belfort]QZE11722.1 hypothetical protein SEA_KARP_147 [Streptomyces phage Karp]UTN92384.1 hypothetical protein SEA_STIGMA_151 [Streptomyces phage Stigma]
MGYKFGQGAKVKSKKTGNESTVRMRDNSHPKGNRYILANGENLFESEVTVPDPPAKKKGLFRRK